MDSPGKRDVEAPIAVNSSGEKLEMEIVNQYGQLMGDFSKLDDELWLSKPDDEEGIAFCREGLDWNIVSNDPHEHISDVQLSGYADNSLTDGGGMTSMENNSTSLTESSLNQCRTVSPISVLYQKRFFSNEIPYVLKRARTRHPANDDSHFVLDDTTDSCSGSLVKTRKITDLLQLNSVENSNLETSQLMKKCLHCDSVKTPQWRDGPLGRKTLCNACGLQYKKGLLSDGNRPLRTVKPPIQVFKKCLHCESIDTPQWRDGPLGRKTLCNACGIQYRKGLLSPDYQPTRSIRFDPYRKKVQEMVTVENSEIDHDSEKFVGDESGITGDMVDSDADRDPDFRPILRRKSKLSKWKDKMCVHCKSTKTPQWREGPLGRKTLCNACGVKYKNGLRFPNYQPVVKTPRFDPYERNVREMVIGLSCIRKENTIKALTGETTDKFDSNPDFKPIPRKFQLPNVEDKKCADCGSTETPQWREGPLGHKTLCNACGVQYKKGSLSLGCLPNRTRILDPYEKEVLDMAVVENTDINLNCTKEENTIVDMTGETNDMLDSDPDPKLDPDFKPIPASKLKLPYVKHKKCAHCESTKTPQWREGPLGRKTLCNACGVQFRQGRLFPEYRPLLSPTYDPSLHSHLPKRVEQMRLRKLSEEGEASGNVDQLV